MAFLTFVVLSVAFQTLPVDEPCDAECEAYGQDYIDSAPLVDDCEVW